MLWIDRVRLALRRGWERVDATLVDSRFVKRKVWGGESPGSFEIWEYMVDVPGPSGGAAVRLTFTEKKFKVRGEPERGNVVPVLVNAKRTKAMFDLSDPRIDREGWVDDQVRQRKQRDDERFEALRAGREPATVDSSDGRGRFRAGSVQLVCPSPSGRQRRTRSCAMTRQCVGRTFRPPMSATNSRWTAVGSPGYRSTC